MHDLKTILIIDDLEANVHTLIELLEDKYDILASLDGESGLELVEEEKVDLILLDIMMPGIDGFEVCSRLKNNAKTKDIPVIFITAYSHESSIEKAYEVGGVDYITKPFKAREVLSRINIHLSLSEQKHHLEHLVNEKTLQLQEKNKKLELSQEIAKLGFWSYDIQHKQLFWSSELYNLFGLDKNSFTPTYENFLDLIHPDDKDQVNETYLKSLEKQISYETVHRICLNNGNIKWIKERCKTSFDKHGKPLISIGTAQDITVDKEKDILIEKQSKLAAMGEMMDAIAHQWKQPLNIISIMINNLKIEALLGDGTISQEQIDETEKDITEQITHLIETIDEFRKFFRPNGNLELVNLKKVILDVINLENNILNANNIQTIVNEEENIEYNLIPTEFKHVIINFISNAKDAFIENNILERKLIFSISKTNTNIVITITDNAGGIPEQILDTIFNANVTTKAEGKGTGIGLYISKQIIEKIDGKLTVKNIILDNTDSEKGARFTIELPLIN